MVAAAPKAPPRPRIADDAPILAFDVSSRAAGVALMRRSGGRVVLDRPWLLKPPADWDVPDRCDWIADKVEEIGRGLGSAVSLAIFEWADGAKWMGRNKGHASSWSYNIAPLIEAQSAARRAILPHAILAERVTSGVWTGRVPKEDRATGVLKRHWRYAPWARRDKGLDLADAIGIGDWRLGL